MPIVGAIVSAINSILKEFASVLQVIPASMTLFMAVWGVLLWANLSSNCDAYYSEAYWALFLVFKINVVLLVIGFVVTLIALCAILVALCVTLSSVSARPDRYENIPDSVEELGRQRNEVEQQAAQSANIPATETYV